MPTPPVIEKSLVDIELKGGLDESGPEESISWQKRLTKAENVVVDGNSLALRPAQLLMDSDVSGQVLRLGVMAQGLGVIANDSTGCPTLGTLNSGATNVDSRGNLPEFSITSLGAGGEHVGISLDAGVAGVVSFTSYKAIAYYGGPHGTPTTDVNGDGVLDNPPRVIVVVLDAKSGNVVRKYVISQPADSYQIQMVGVDDRYLHIYRSAETGVPAIKPGLTVIDTNSLPAETATLTWTDLTGTANGDLIAGACAITGASVVATKGSTTRVEKFNNSAASQASSNFTGFTNCTGIDTDGTSFYLSGYGPDTADAPSLLTLSGWWRADYDGSAPWVGEASAGSSGGRNLSLGSEPGTGTVVNSKTPPGFNGTSEYLAETTLTMNNYFTAAAYTAVVLVKPTSAPAPHAQVYNNDMFIATIPIYFGICWSTSGVKAFHYDGAYKETAWVACAADAYAMVHVTYDGTNISLAVNNGAPVTIAAGNILNLSGVNLNVSRGGDTISYAAEDVLEVITAPSVLNGTALSDIKSYFNSRYALSL